MNLLSKGSNNFETVLDLAKINLRLRDQKFGSDLYSIYMHPYSLSYRMYIHELEHTCKYFVT